MENKFTPGKWSYHKAEGINLEVYNDEQLRTRVCIIPYDDFEGIANAKLIAAAPELLEALIAAKKLAEFQGLETTETYNIINSAITKATE
jgi:hypothetical protein